MQRDGGLTGGLRSVDFHHAAARHAAHAQRDIQIQTAGWDHLNVLHRTIAHADDGALAKLLFDASKRHIQRALLLAVYLFFGRNLLGRLFLFGCHVISPSSYSPFHHLRGPPPPQGGEVRG